MQVGGFLGLLLGASILTVCEILDFIFMAVAAAWRKKKIRGQVTQVVELEKNGRSEDKNNISIIEAIEKNY